MAAETRVAGEPSQVPRVRASAAHEPRRRRQLPHPAVTRTIVLVGLLLLLELLTQNGTISPLIIPPPTEIAAAVFNTVGTSAFAADLARTGTTVAASFGIGTAVGSAIGIVLWRWPLLNAALAPLLAAMYATPFLIFYPILIVALGLGTLPIIAVASLVATIPIALNVTAGLEGVPGVLLRLGRSLHCSRRQRWQHVILPAALPTVMTGLRLGCIYAMILTLAMEFVLATKGLGFRIAIDYRAFEVADMWAGIVLVALLAMAVSAAMRAIERRVRRDML
jgi:NitT/TauT family transport system permease protein